GMPTCAKAPRASCESSRPSSSARSPSSNGSANAHRETLSEASGASRNYWTNIQVYVLATAQSRRLVRDRRPRRILPTPTCRWGLTPFESQRPRGLPRRPIHRAVHGIAMPDARTRIWKLWWTIAAPSLFPLAIATHVQTRAPTNKVSSKSAIAPEPIPPAPIPPHKDYVVCGFDGGCWQGAPAQGRDARRIRGPVVGASPGTDRRLPRL